MVRLAVLMIIVFLREVYLFTVEVNVKQGKLLGTSCVTVFDKKLYFAFYGVPYAQPPIGKLRFKDPKSPKKLKIPLDVRTEYHGACAQAHVVHKHGVYGVEDCLYLNIYTPHIPKDGKQTYIPVIVWIHGYAFTSSFSHVHGADFLIDSYIIVISVVHRIGAFGFLKYNRSDTHANMGLKDIHMALKWIKSNIKVFGGDPNNITVMGSGSAATFLSMLLMTKSKKLFSKMILQSGALFTPSLFLGDHNIERSRLGLALEKSGIKDIKSASTKDIIMASQKIYSNQEVVNHQRPLIPFLPVIEKQSSKSLLTYFTDHFHSDDKYIINKPILMGFNTKESIPEVIPFIHNPSYLRSLGASFKYMVPFTGPCKFNYSSHTYKSVANMIKTFYFKNKLSEKSLDNFLQYTTDLIKYPIYKFIKTFSNIMNTSVYMYKFHFNGHFNIAKATSMATLSLKVKGAASGDEICYILKCEPLWESYVKVNDQNNTDRIFIKKITELWSNFARTSRPTPTISYLENGTWPPIYADFNNVMLINREFKLIDSKNDMRMMKFWNDVYQKYYEICKHKHRDEL